MPDIRCVTARPARSRPSATAKRHEAYEYRQAWFIGLAKEGDECDHYWPVESRR
jgi:hypothetical protein